MPDLNVISPFPNPGVRLIKEDDHIAIWEEVFEPGKPTPPHRHTRDYIAIFLNAGQLTIMPVAGEAEEVTIAAGQIKDSAAKNGGVRFTFAGGTVIHGRVPGDGTAHFALNEGTEPANTIIIEIKGTGSERNESDYRT